MTSQTPEEKDVYKAIFDYEPITPFGWELIGITAFVIFFFGVIILSNLNII